MNKISRRDLIAYAAVALALSGFLGCQATQLSDVTRDPTYDPHTMRRVFVIAVVKTDRAKKMLEDEFVRQLQKSGRDAVASYTMLRDDTPLDPETLKKLLVDNRFDTVIISRLVHMDVKEKEYGAKVIARGNPGSGYYTYGSYYASTYQPGVYVREQTASVETRVFDVATARQVWSAHSKTEIAWGGDPVPQVRTFIKMLFNEAHQ